MKTIQGKVLFGVIPIPKDVTWYKLYKNNTGEFITKTLDLGGYFLQYGTETGTYYNPSSFYAVSKYDNPEIIGKLSEITEQQASELVDMSMFYNGFFKNYTTPESSHRSDQCKTAKSSLVSLLKANDCWIKEWKEKPNPINFDVFGVFDAADRFHEAEKQYNNTPDDWLVVKLDNTPPTPK